MEFDRQLTDVLSEFARTLVTDFPIQSILDHLVARIVDVLPITAAGVTLIAPGSGPRYVAITATRPSHRVPSPTDSSPCSRSRYATPSANSARSMCTAISRDRSTPAP